MRSMMTTRSLVTAFSTLMTGIATVGCMEQALDPLDPIGTTGKSTPTPAPTPTPTPTPAPTPAPAPLPPAKTPTLFVSNNTANGVLSFANPATANGNVAPTTNLSGGQTKLTSPHALLVNELGTLITASRGPDAIVFHDQGVRATGNLSPDRNISGPATGSNFPVGMAWDAATDTLFTAHNGLAPNPGFILAYADASDSATAGNRAPITRITSADLGTPSSIALNAAGDLFVSNMDKRTIVVFDNAATVNGLKSADRVISSPALVGVGNIPQDITLNAQDQLFVLTSVGRVLVFDNASSLNGNVMPDSVLQISGAASVQGIAVDSKGVGYIADSAANRIFVYDAIATRNGTFAADRLITGGSTQMNGPTRLFIDE